MDLEDLALNFFERIGLVKPKLVPIFYLTNPPSDVMEVRGYNKRTGEEIYWDVYLRVSRKSP